MRLWKFLIKLKLICYIIPEKVTESNRFDFSFPYKQKLTALLILEEGYKTWVYQIVMGSSDTQAGGDGVPGVPGMLG